MGEKIREDPAKFVYWLCQSKSKQTFNFSPQSSDGQENIPALDFFAGLIRNPEVKSGFLKGLGKQGTERMRNELMRYKVSEVLVSLITTP